MKAVFQSIFILLIVGLFITETNAQIAINSDGADPDASAMLDIMSSEKGILIPRMDSTARTNISTPAEGLMVYDSTTNSFWFYTDVWTEISGDNLGNHEATQNIQLSDYYISNDGASEGIQIDSNGYVGIGLKPENHLSVNMGVESANEESVAITSPSGSIGPIGESGQTYTATISGNIDNVQLRMNSSGVGDRTVSIYEGVGNTGILLGSVTMDITDGGLWDTYDFSGQSISQDSGEIYTVYIDDAYSWNFNNSDVYPDGESLYNSEYDFSVKVYTFPNNNGFHVSESGVTINDYSLPNSDGTSNQYLMTDGNGNVSWSNEDIASMQSDIATIESSISTIESDIQNLEPVGVIQMWPTSTPPTGWLICDGSTFSASTYPELNTVLGGNTLPDFSGRFPLGAGNSGTTGSSSHSLGSNGGEEQHVLTISEMPSHSHDITYSSKNKSGSGGEVSDLEASASTTSTEPEGGGEAHNNMPPYYTINFIIKAE